jgi:hypothetical protein
VYEKVRDVGLFLLLELQIMQGAGGGGGGTVGAMGGQYGHSEYEVTHTGKGQLLP